MPLTAAFHSGILETTDADHDPSNLLRLARREAALALAEDGAEESASSSEQVLHAPALISEERVDASSEISLSASITSGLPGAPGTLSRFSMLVSSLPPTDFPLPSAIFTSAADATGRIAACSAVDRLLDASDASVKTALKSPAFHAASRLSSLSSRATRAARASFRTERSGFVSRPFDATNLIAATASCACPPASLSMVLIAWGVSLFVTANSTAGEDASSALTFSSLSS
mmetsp:Transcript_56113/g.114723  ORF Transcript_56113/g.114723 Transcript_56113/m.114723 type:complete len:231 (+) Transcript_56113:1158-1850(+)